MTLKTSTILLIIFLAILCAIFSTLSPYFLNVANLLNILVATVTIGILAIGASFVIGSAGLDLSVGSIMALSATTAMAIATSMNAPWFMIIVVCLATGLLVGAINGGLIGFRHIPAFIVTLAMLSIARGLALLISNGRPTYGLPENIIFIGQGSIFGVPVPVLIFLIVCLFAYFLLSHTRFGWHTLAIGDNEEASKNAGIKVNWHKVKLYAFSGFLAALAGLIFMGRVNASDPTAGTMYELTAITAAIIGGTSLFGGKASVVGAVLGALIMGVLQNGLNLMSVPAYYQQLAVGGVLILAVSFNSFDFKTWWHKS